MELEADSQLPANSSAARIVGFPGCGDQGSLRSRSAQRVLQPSHQTPPSQGAGVTRAGAAQMELPKAPCPMDQRGMEALGAFTGGCTGHHLGATMTRHSKAPYPVLGSRVVTHFMCSPFPPAPAHETHTEVFRQGRQHQAAPRSRLEDPCACSGGRSPCWCLLFWFGSSHPRVSATWSCFTSSQELGCATEGLLTKRNPPQGPSLGRMGLFAVNTK